MSIKTLKKAVSFVLSFNLLLQSFSPFLITPVYATDGNSTPSASTTDVTPTPELTATPTETPTPTEEVTPTPELTPEVTPTVSPEQTPAITPEPTATPTIDVTPTIEPIVSPSQETSSEPTSNPDAQAPPSNTSTSADTTTTTNTVPESITIVSQLQQNLTAAPTLSTDKSDYFPTDTAYISGIGFVAGAIYDLHISSSDNPFVSFHATVTADENSHFTYAYQLDGNYRPNYTIEALDASGVVVVSYSFTDSNPSANLDQCANLGTVCDTAHSSQWVNGNLGSSKATYVEGDSIPYRLTFSSLSLGSHTVKIEWDTTKSGKHAIDYLTTFNRTVGTADPCSGVSGCGSLSPYGASNLIPNDTNAAITKIAGNLSIYGGNITGISPYTVSGSYAGDSSTSITITFNATQANPVLAWSGHIGTRADWGQTMAATAIPGSPYHTRLLELDGSGGNQDKSLSADAVIYPASITVVKDANINGSTSFGFTASPSPLANFNLVDDGNVLNNTKVFSNITNFTTYSVAESATPGWSLTGINCSVDISNGGSQTVTNPSVSINLKEGENVSCTFNNTLQNGTLTVQKTTIPAADPTQFTVNATGSGTITGGGAGIISDATDKVYTVGTGTYSVTETVPAGWTQTGNTCTGVVVAAGQNTTCLITNTKDATLTVTKVVTNDNGGAKVVSDFPLFVNGNSVTSGAINTFTAGTYTIGETNQTGYTQTSIVCDNNKTNPVILNAGDNVSCTVTNDDVQPKLTVTKVVVNNHGGTKVVSDFPLFVNGNSVTSGVQNGFNTGSYTISETNSAGYSSLISGDCDANGTISLTAGDVKACTITNTDSAPQLTVIKHVINNNGGTLTASNFTMNVTATNSSSSSFAGDESGTVITLDAGSYSVDETSVSGYAKTLGADCSGSIAVGQSKTCTITNDDVAPSLTLTKIVINDNGGTRIVSNFSLFIDLLGVASGTSNTLNAGTYTVSESNPSSLGYLQTGIGGDCNLQGVITLGLGENKVCTITNNDIQPKLIVYKHVINDNGGSLTSNNFTLNVTGTNVSVTSFPGSEAGTEIALDAGTYSVDELTNDGYAKTLGADCSGSIAVGETKYCTITNDDIAPKLTVTKIVVGSDNPVSDFPLYVDATNVLSGEQNVFDANTYTISEDNLIGFTSVISGDCNVDGLITLNSGDIKSCTITNTRDTGNVTVTKYNDKNGNGVRDAGEETLAGWEINLSGQDPQTTGADGTTTFSNIQTGEHVLSENIQKGWKQTNISCNNITTEVIPTPTPTPTPAPNPNNICHKTNSEAHPWNALSVPINNHVHDSHDADYPYAGPVSANGHPDKTGETWCANNVPVQENLITGLFKSLVGTVYAFEETIQNLIDNDNNHPVTVIKDTTINCEIGNQFITPSLEIVKSNNAIGTLSAGGSVQYTITLNVTENDLNGVTVTDLPPQGFKYRPGSYQVFKNGVDITSSITEPAYHSPGVWHLGDASNEDQFQLVYLADIDSAQDPGLYNDLVWAKGTSPNDSSTILATVPGTDESFIADTFAGTHVVIDKDLTNSISIEVKKTGEVLGASTSLPATGANELWLLLAALLVGTGSVSLYYGMKNIKHD